MKIITRVEAAKAGLNRYYTGKKCKHGHDSERYVLSGTCVECAVESADKHKKSIAEVLRIAQEGAE
ncbi:hypothetical protein LUS60_06700 [Raoultella planticola]|uniref:hypothetical protein n=1 Tax=Raoultella ornithinolytica TaxID=54291 RepID=UPI000B4CF144|nr:MULTISPECIES: hypothetical protein [Raoultella]MCD9604981.1 hypothetical protein [Raoultella planticola]OWP44711.1 hypothetical protein CEG93_02155 [Raoultella ornithinolytica]HDS7793368.1 hypothetical protein [Raoultella ornithinolytica]HEC2558091.1 hypothetical protein [Raoultella ornithinolytica]